MNHPDERKEQNRIAAKKYYATHKDDPEFKERKMEATRKSVKKSYRKKRAAMTEEELEEFRRKTRERVAKYREKKKAEKLALEATKDTQEEEQMKLIDVDPVLTDLKAIADVLPEDKREVIDQAIRILEEQPEIPVKGTV